MSKISKVLITVVLIAAVATFYIIRYQKTDKVEQPTTEIQSTSKTSLTDEDYIKAVGDDGDIIVKGDINHDGYVDAIVGKTFCGASCSIELIVVMNNENKTATAREDVSFDGYKAGSATKSDVEKITIEDGVISVIGKGLDCYEDCTEEKWNMIRKIRYVFVNGKMSRLQE